MKFSIDHFRRHRFLALSLKALGPLLKFRSCGTLLKPRFIGMLLKAARPLLPDQTSGIFDKRSAHQKALR